MDCECRKERKRKITVTKKKREENRQKRREVKDSKKKPQKVTVNPTDGEKKENEFRKKEIEESELSDKAKPKTLEKKSENGHTENLNEAENVKCTAEERIDHKETLTVLEQNLKENSYVIVKYEGKYYPGKILEMKDDLYKISTMAKTLNHWKWPEKEDILFYDKEDIVKVIVSPKKLTSRRTFSVPEITDFDLF